MPPAVSLQLGALNFGPPNTAQDLSIYTAMREYLASLPSTSQGAYSRMVKLALSILWIEFAIFIRMNVEWSRRRGLLRSSNAHW
jgi:hypothetical protein